MIIQQDSEGKTIAEYPTLKDAERATGVPDTNIRAVINGRRNTAGSFYWAERFDEVEETDEQEPAGHTFQHEYNTDNIKFSGVLKDIDIHTLDQLLEYTDVDLTLWEVKNYTTKVWTTTMKKRTLIDSGTAAPPVAGKGFVGKALYEHSALRVTNVGFTVNFVPRTDFKVKLIESLKTHVSALPTLSSPKRREGGKVVEFMITDHHLGKHGFDSRTMEFCWDLPKAMQEYSNVIDFGLSKIDTSKVDYFILPTGNDLLHVDGGLGQTTSGQKIADELFFLNLFKYAKEAVALSIRKLVEFAPVKVIFIPGNHDENAVLMLSEVIKAMFDGNGNVEVICRGNGREYEQYGVNLIGWHHGKGNNPQKASNMMIADVPELFAKAKFRTVHVGHTHTSSKTNTVTLNTLKEEHGIIYEICPALCPTDRWHDQNLYIGNLRRCKIFQYDKLNGLEAEYTYSIE